MIRSSSNRMMIQPALGWLATVLTVVGESPTRKGSLRR